MTKMSYWIMPDKLEARQQVQTKKAKQVINDVCRRYDIKKVELLGKTRRQPVADARAVCFYVLHKKNRISSTLVAKIFDRTHATVLSGANKIEGYLGTDAEMRNIVKGIELRTEKKG